MMKAAQQGGGGGGGQHGSLLAGGTALPGGPSPQPGQPGSLMQGGESLYHYINRTPRCRLKSRKIIKKSLIAHLIDVSEERAADRSNRFPDRSIDPFPRSLCIFNRANVHGC